MNTKGLRALLLGLFVICPPVGAWSEEAASTATSTAPVAFSLNIHAPAPLDAFLLRHAELQNFQTLSDLSPKELQRLLLTSPDDLRQLLASQGYFSPQIELQLKTTPLPPEVDIHIEPGPVTQVATQQVVLKGTINSDPHSKTQRDTAVNSWPWAIGDTFTQAGWDEAKQALLHTLTQYRYPEAHISHSSAEIDTEHHQAHLLIEIDSGPAYRVGELQIQGHERYATTDIEHLVHLAGVTPGTVYDETALQHAQQRLLEYGPFESVFVRLDTRATPDAAPVEVNVREAPTQKIVMGIGASTDNGARLSLEHLHHRVPGLDWRATSKLQWERDTQTVQTAFDSPITAQGWRWNVAGMWQREENDPLVTSSEQLKIGRTYGWRTLERQFYAEYDRTDTDNTRLHTQDAAVSSVSAHYAWTQRHFNSLTLPTEGQGLTWEIGSGVTLSQDRQPYLRTRLRWLAYFPTNHQQPAGNRWAMRLDGGVVWSSDESLVPATQRFLAGGTGSVRGYGLHEIGVTRSDGGTDPGRLLALASIEWQHPLHTEQTSNNEWESTLFIDAGAVANHMQTLKPKIGIGTGLRYRSPVGPLQIDLAYGLEQQAFRLHMSVGFTF